MNANVSGNVFVLLQVWNFYFMIFKQMLRRFFYIFLFFLPSILVAQNAKQYYKMGEQNLDNGLTEDALANFTEALLLDPKYSEAYLIRAKTHLLLGDTLKAASDYNKAAVLGHEPEINYFEAAKLYYALDNSRSALENIHFSLLAKPKYFDAQLLKTQIFADQQNYTMVLSASRQALEIKENGIALYYHGLAALELGLFEQAEMDLEKAIIKDDKNSLAYLALARVQIKQKKYDYAIDNSGFVLILLNPKSIEAATIRAEAYFLSNQPELCIADISRAITLDGENSILYQRRGEYFLGFERYPDAINDFSTVLSKNHNTITSLTKRADAYEKNGNLKESVADYKALAILLKNENSETTSIQFVEEKLFTLGKESKKPIIDLSTPSLSSAHELKINRTETEVTINGIVKDDSPIKNLRINNLEVDTINADGSFSTTISATNLDFISISAIDIYDNMATVSYPVKKIELNTPQIKLLSPLAATGSTISIELEDNFLYLDGTIEDESPIKTIRVDEVNASFTPGELNPRFTATIDIRNKTNITIIAEDTYGNSYTQTYGFTREEALVSTNNPMGKTWVVFIENSNYKEYPNLTSPEKDIRYIQESLDRYKISKVIHKQNLTKAEMERFFSLDLRDLIKSNQINSLLIWYAGHGTYLHESGYWIPVNAKLNDEFGFYNINALKASLYSYTSLTHLLVVSDACEAGPGFQIAMRGFGPQTSCTEKEATQNKSSLVLTSSNEEVALDNTLFAKAFGNALQSNPGNCISINKIAEKVSIVMLNETNQKPIFGKISGLQDKNGTFFFIAKD